jgi:hypothetical protein
MAGQREDLSTWRQLGEAEWRFSDDGVEAGPGETSGFLVSPVAYDDFQLTAEFRIEDNTNSGIFFRCPESDVVGDVNPDKCYELNIWDNHPNQEFRTGSIVKLAKPLEHVDTLNRWNRYEIVARGAMIEVTLNDVVVVRIVGDRAASGYIALQYAGKAALQFRNLQVLELVADER